MRGRRLGSSPLARGLHNGLVGRSVPHGIIPARAGFTLSRARARAWVRDHPRSRGVYRKGRRTGDWDPGSSPLARGLHHCPRDDGSALRIIPARAGFTPSPGAATAARRDHPRSRGVYSPPTGRGRRAPGSSPLARGLLIIYHSSSSIIRIIPARAGFTPHGRPGRSGRRDHPRSRGVYPPSSTWATTARGSSPLARGLHLRILGIPTNP